MMLIIKMKELKLREAKYLPHTEQRAKLVKVRTASDNYAEDTPTLCYSAIVSHNPLVAGIFILSLPVRLSDLPENTQQIQGKPELEPV